MKTNIYSDVVSNVRPFDGSGILYFDIIFIIKSNEKVDVTWYVDQNNF
jgi:hypothetical protein